MFVPPWLWLLLPEPFPAGGSSRADRDVAPALPTLGGGTSGLSSSFWALLLSEKEIFLLLRAPCRFPLWSAGQ